jgi:hypothetical protein
METPRITLRKETFSEIENWAKSHPTPKNKIPMLEGFYQFSPQQIAIQVKKNTTFGKWYAGMWQENSNFRENLKY